MVEVKVKARSRRDRMEYLEVGRRAVHREVARELRVQPAHLPEQHPVLPLEALLERRARARAVPDSVPVRSLSAIVQLVARLVAGLDAREAHRAAGRLCAPFRVQTLYSLHLLCNTVEYFGGQRRNWSVQYVYCTLRV